MHAAFIKTLSIVLIGLFLSSGCQTITLATDLGIIGLSDQESSKPSEQLNIVRSETCVTKVLGYGPESDLTQALNRFKSQYPDLRFVTRLRLTRRFQSYVFFERECWSARGIGYR